MNVKTRQRIEKRIAKQIVKSALALGYTISVNNGGDEHELEQSLNSKDIHAAMFATDEERLYFYDLIGKCYGWVYLVYGNDGWDVMADWSDNVKTNEILKEAEELADKLEDEYA